MFQVKGIVQNVFNKPSTEKFDATYKVQLLGELPLPDGQIQNELITLNVPPPVYDIVSKHMGEEITLPIGFYIKDSKMVTFFPKGGTVLK